MAIEFVKTRIVILGGGFAGIEAARHLDQTIATRSDVDVFLVSEENYTVFTPMLHEVAAGDLEPMHICNPLRELLKNVTILTASVESIDLAAKKVLISYGVGLDRRELSFDQLVLALGSETNYASVPGAADRAIGIKTLGDAILVRAHVLGLLETANVEPDRDRRKAMLTFVVVGGGFAGVESIGAINDLARESVTRFNQLDPADIRVILIHGGAVILPELGEALGLYAQKNLGKRKVEFKLKTHVKSYSAGTVNCDDGESIPADMVVWAAGVSPNPALKSMPFELQKGRIVVDFTLEVPGHPGIWAAGDCAAILDPISKLPYPPTAQHALREGKLIGKNIVARLNGAQAKPFEYKAPGQLASIGRRTGVARIFGMNFSGWIGWILWRTIYLMKLPRFEKKLRVGIQWLLNVFFERDLAQYFTRQDVSSLDRLLSAAKKRAESAKA
jgi:NADH:ubiquinone reductase (H+-translocating)